MGLRLSTAHSGEGRGPSRTGAEAGDEPECLVGAAWAACLNPQLPDVRRLRSGRGRFWPMTRRSTLLRPRVCACVRVRLRAYWGLATTELSRHRARVLLWFAARKFNRKNASRATHKSGRATAQAVWLRRRRSSINEPIASPPSATTGMTKRALRIVPPHCRSDGKSHRCWQPQPSFPA